MTTKICSKCHVEKPLTAFRGRCDRPKYRRSVCKACDNSAARAKTPKKPEGYHPDRLRDYDTKKVQLGEGHTRVLFGDKPLQGQKEGPRSSPVRGIQSGLTRFDIY